MSFLSLLFISSFELHPQFPCSWVLTHFQFYSSSYIPIRDIVLWSQVLADFGMLLLKLLKKTQFAQGSLLLKTLQLANNPHNQGQDRAAPWSKTFSLELKEILNYLMHSDQCFSCVSLLLDHHSSTGAKCKTIYFVHHCSTHWQIF